MEENMEKMRLLLLILLFYVLPCSAAEQSKEGNMTFVGWEKETKINIDPIDSDAHNAFIDIYVNALAKKTYVSEAAPYPVGARVYKPLYPDEKRSEISKLVIMVKMQPGYDPQNNDWWYGVTDETGSDIYYQGRIRSCIDCHKEAEGTDYMFSQSVMGKINCLAELYAEDEE
jgi:hypothetical protein